MLVLARKPNQSIMVGDNIEIKIIEIKGDQIKIGIAAPRSVSVHRKEIYDEIKEANLKASKKTESLEQFKKIAVQIKAKPNNSVQE